MSAAPRRTGPGRALAGMLGVAVVAGLMLTVGVVPAIALTGMGAKSGIGMFEDLPQDLKIAKLQQKTEIYAKRGKDDVLLASFYNQNRDVIAWKDVSATVKNATLAAEDVRFYDHGGVDPMGIVRALAVNVVHKGNQGASTISQQYVKNVCVQEAELLPTPEKVQAAYDECTGGVQRKLREARLAIGLEKTYPKDTILLGYLNIAGFGGRIYGIESAAHYYFDTDTKDLTPAQAASLMAIVNNPNVLRIDDPKNIPANTVRRDYILKNMLDHRMLDQEAYEQAIATKVKPKITPTKTGCAGAPSGAGFFCDYVAGIIRSDPMFGKTPTERDLKLQSAGWKIYTTLDLSLQKKAQNAMTDHVPAKSPSGTNLGGAAVSVEVGTGRIISMVQNKRFDDSQGKGTKGSGYTATSVNFNTDTDNGASGGFQPGSTFKTFTLIDWLENGHGLNEIVQGSPQKFPAGSFQCANPDGFWAPGNDTDNEGGYQTVMAATAGSVNGAYASMAQKLKICDIVKQAEKLDVHRADKTPMEENPPAILGSNSNTIAPLTMATAYAGIAHKGVVCSSIAIDHIETADGKDVPAPTTSCHRAIPESIAVATGFALHGVLHGGTASADVSGTGSAWGFAKTGTTDFAHSTWVVGGTTKTVTATWVGNISGEANLRKIFGWSPGRAASDARHAVWTEIQAANQAKYPGDTSWPQPAAQYMTGQKIDVPNVVGKSLDEAKDTLQKAGFQVKTGDRVYSDDVDAGLVASTDPGAGAQLTAGSIVVLAKSRGPKPQEEPTPDPQQTGTVVPVPQVAGNGLTEQQARSALSGAGFTDVRVVHMGRGQACIVDNQRPRAGQPWDTSKPVFIDVPGSTDPNNPCQ